MLACKKRQKMLREFLNSKIHRATVTDANLNYVGSITIDEEFLDRAGIMEWEKVEILNINNGERFQTYALKGKRGSKCFCLNGAAARKAQPGDKIIIVTYAQLTPEEIKTHKPTIVQVGENNEIL
jgi:aspartate 1-decarboxylase